MPPQGPVNDRECLHKILASVGRLEGRMDGVASELTRLADAQIASNGRTRKLEAAVARMLGYASGAAAVVALAVSLLLNLL